MVDAPQKHVISKVEPYYLLMQTERDLDTPEEYHSSVTEQHCSLFVSPLRKKWQYYLNIINQQRNLGTVF